MSNKPKAGNGKIIALAKPEAGQHIVVDAPAAGVLVLDFDQESVIPARTENNLVFKIGDSSITITKFFEVEENGSLPSLKLASGELLDASDYLRGINPSLDLTIVTAAGPASPSLSASMSGGLNDYGDGGDLGLIGGVNALGMLEGGLGSWGGFQNRREDLEIARLVPELDANALTNAATLFESQLAFGTGPYAHGLTRTITIPQGYSLVLDSNWALQPDGSYQQLGSYGVFTYRDGALSYTLQKNSLDHSLTGNQQAGDIVSDGIILRLSNLGAFGAEQDILCSVAIQDDAPVISLFARNGNVESGDSLNGNFDVNFGADGPLNNNGIIVEFTVNGVTTTLNGQTVGSAIHLTDANGVTYGILTLDSNGKTFTFQSLPNINTALNLRIAAVDGDNDIVFANNGNPIVITITKPEGPDPNKTIGDGSDETLDESHLSTGTNPDVNSLVQNIAMPAGGFKFDTSTGWVPVAGQTDVFTLDGKYGTLTYNAATNTLTYLLKSALAHESGDGKNIGFDDFGNLVLTDPKGNTYTVPCKIQIVDDIPELALVVEGTEVASGAEINGIWDIHFGADKEAILEPSFIKFTLDGGKGASVLLPFTAGVPVDATINGIKYGTLTLNANGTLIFKAEPNIEEKIYFHLGAWDSDGDFVQSDKPGYVLITKPAGPGWVIGVQEGEEFYESNLPGGTNPSPNDLQQDLALPEGYTIDVSKGGWTLDNGNYVLEGAAGTLIYDPNTNTLSYKLKNPLEHGNPGPDSSTDDFGSIIMLDKHGNEFEIPCEIILYDDVPEVDFSSNNPTVTIGDTLTGTWDIQFGADGADADNPLQLIFTAWGDKNTAYTIKDVQHNTAYDVIIDGINYGSITINSDGSFSFKSNPGAPEAKLTVSLGATDSDGDYTESSISLILDSPGVIPEHTVIGKEVVMNEAHLPEGTASDPNALTQTITLPAGSTVNTASPAWVHDAGANTYTLQGQYGYLTLNNGVLTYTLTKEFAHTVQGNDSGFDSMNVSLLDTNGKEVTVVCKVEIRDDIPNVDIAADNSKIEAGETVTGQWNVEFGADGEAILADRYVLKFSTPDGISNTVSIIPGGTVEVVIGGNSYGFLTLNADGTFKFVTEPNLHDTILTVAFGAHDSELDYSEDSFTVVIDKQPTGPVLPTKPIGDGTSFDEAHLGDGTDPTPGSLTQQFTIPHGFTVLPNTADGWVAVTGMPDVFQINGAHGVLTYNKQANTLTYTLTDASNLHTTQGKDSITEALGTNGKITLVDDKGTTYLVNCETVIVDDMPLAGNLGIGTDVQSGGQFTGSYQALIGADGTGTSGKIVITVLLEDKTTLTIDISAGAGTYQIGKYGSITLSNAGEFTFKANPNIEATLKLGFELIDGDGDTVSSLDPTIINIYKPGGPGPIGSKPGEEASESFLPEGTAADNTKCVIVLEVPADYEIKMTPSWQNVGADNYKLTGEFGYLTYNTATGELTYTLTNPAGHLMHDLTTTDDFGRLVLVDKGGNEFNIPCKVTVEDDAPVVDLDAADTATSGDSVAGTWSVSYGADGAANDNPLQVSITANGKNVVFTDVVVGTPLNVTIDGVTYGTVTFNADKTFVFNTVADIPSTKFEITLGAKDQDNDYREENITLTVVNGDKPVIGTGPEEWFNEANLTDGTSENLTALSKVLDIPAGYTLVLDANWVQTGSVYTLSGPNGSLTWNGTTLTYTLTSKYAHTDEGRDSFFQNMGQLTLNDGVADVKVDCIIEIRDDVPVVTITSPATSMENGSTIDGTWGAKYGADGMAVNNAFFVEVSLPDGTVGRFENFSLNTPTVVVIGANSYGLLTLNTDGTFSFTAEKNLDGQLLTFTVGATDGDGDTTTASFKIEITRPVIPVDPDPFAGTEVNEANLPDGTNADPNALTQILAVPATETVKTAGWTSMGSSVFRLEGGFGYLEYNTLTNELKYVLTKASQAHSGQGCDSALDSFPDGITLVDADLNERNVPLNVIIVDDIPAPEFTVTGNTVDSGMSINGDWSLLFGADGPNASKPSFLTVTNLNGDVVTIDVAVAGGTYEVKIGTTVYGTLHLNAHGKFVFTTKPNIVDELTLSLTLTDGDGDIVTTGNATVAIKKPGGPTDDIGSGIIFDEQYLGSGTNPDPSQLTKEIPVPTGFTIYTEGFGNPWTPLGSDLFKLSIASGDLEYNSQTNTLTFIFKNPLSHTGTGNDMHIFDAVPFVTVVDKYGNQYPNIKVQINVADDDPQVTLAATSPTEIVSGNEVAGIWDLKFGADGQDTKGIQIKVAISGSSDSVTLDNMAIGIPTAVSITKKGVPTEYGTITLKADGTFVFTAKPNLDNVRLTVTLTGTDTDGDSVSKSIDLSIKSPTDPGLDPIGKDASFNEANLPDGTNENSAALTQEFVIPATYTLVVSGAGGWNQNGNIWTREYPDYGTLTYDEGSKKLTFELKHNHSHPNEGADTSTISLGTLTVKDALGNDSSIECVLNLQDDMPTVTFDQSSYAVFSGMEFTGELDVVFGADGQVGKPGTPYSVTVSGPGGTSMTYAATIGTAQTIIINGNKYGDLTLDANGKFTFKASPDLDVTLKVTVEATDGDGDKVKSTADIVITKPGGPPITELGGDDKEKVFESNLPEGTNANSNDLTKEFALPDGYKTVDITGWISIGSGSHTLVAGSYGFLTYNTVTKVLTYTLNQASDKHSDKIANDIFNGETVTIILKDEHGNSYNVTCRPQIVDDIPEVSLAGDSKPVESGTIYTGEFEYTFGADGKSTITGKPAVQVKATLPNNASFEGEAVVGTPVSIVINGKNYGELTLLDNGTFTFKADPSASGSLSLKVGITDADGDTAWSAGNGLTITITPPGPIDLVIGDDAAFYEGHLLNGTKPTSTELSKVLSLTDTVGNVYTVDTSVGSWGTAVGGVFTWQGTYGKMTWDGTTLTYTLENPLSVAGAGSNTAFDPDFSKMGVLNKNGAPLELVCKINITDDIPAPEFTVTGNTVDSGMSINGDWSLLFGADGPNASKPSFLTVTNLNGDVVTIDVAVAGGTYEVKIGTTVYGTLHLNAHGKFVFTTKPNIVDELTLSLTLTDGDGDIVTTGNATVAIKKPGGPTDDIGSGIIFDEQYLGSGTNPDPSQLTKEIPVPTGFTIYTEGFGNPWTPLGSDLFKLSIASGDLEYNSQTNTLTFIFKNPLSHTGTGNDMHIFDAVPFVTVVDKYGNQYPNIKVQINVADDDPQVTLAATSPTEIVSGNEVAGIWDLKFGADGQDTKGIQIKVAISGSSDSVTLDNMAIGIPTAVSITKKGVPTEYGTITLKADGTFVFTAKPNLDNVRLTVTLTGTDTDGDSVSKSIDLSIKSPTDPGLDPIGKDASFNEANLPDGTNENSAALTQEFVIPATYTLVVSGAGGWNQNGNIWTREYPDYGTLTYDDGSKKLTFELKHNHSHPNEGADTSTISLGTLTVKDALGNDSSIECVLNLQDDMPTVTFDQSRYAVFSGMEFTGELDVVFGADGQVGKPGTPYSVTVSGPGGTSMTYAATIGTAQAIIISGNKYGDLTLDANGKFTFKASPDLDVTLKVTVEATDGDGDKIKSTADIVIAKPGGPPITGLGGDDKEKVSESNLPEGTNANSNDLTKEFALPDGYKTVDITGWTSIGSDSHTLVAGSYGFLTYNTVTKVLTYTLNQASDRHSGVIANDIFNGETVTIILKDEHGNSYNVTCRPQIVDDIPVVAILNDKDLEGSDANGFNVSGDIDVQSGADGFLNDDGTSIKIALAWDMTGSGDGSGTKDVSVPLDGSSVKVTTALGEITLTYVNGKVHYDYQVLKGKAADKEVVTITAVDGEGDSVNDSLSMTLLEDFTGGVVVLDEAGVDGIGSNQASDLNMSFLKVLGVGVESEVTTIEWDMTSLPNSLQASATPNGTYTQVTWQQVDSGTAGQPLLVAYDGDGKAVLTLTPEFENGFFTGRVDANLSGAFQHGPGADNLEFNLGMNLTDSTSKEYPVGIGVNIKDDTPGGGSGGAEAWIEVEKNSLQPQNVVIAFDASNSVDDTSFKEGIEAVLALLNTYIDEGLTATFSFVLFAQTASLFSSKEFWTAGDLRDAIATHQANNYSSLRNTISSRESTNYEAPLLIVQNIFSTNNPLYSDYAKTLYFISDGVPNSGDLDIKAWQAYCNSFGTDVTSYALGVGEILKNPGAMAALSKVTNGDLDNIFAVADYALLLEQLENIVEQRVEGDMLGSLRSADLTSVVSIMDEYGTLHTFANGVTKLEISLGQNVMLTIFEDGTYIISKMGQMNGDIHASLKLVVTDSDGDSRETTLNIICKDVGISAYDNIGVIQPQHDGSALAVVELYQKGSTGFTVLCENDGLNKVVNSSTPIANTGYKYAVPYIPGIPGVPAYANMDVRYIETLNTQGFSSGDGTRLAAALGTNDYVPLLKDLGLFLNDTDMLGHNSSVSMNLSVPSTGGIVAFNWAFKAGASEDASDAAFWVVLDAAKNIVASGLLHQGNDGKWASGVQYVNLPDEGNYTLLIVSQNMTDNNAVADSDPCTLVLKSMYLLNSDVPGQCSGNVISDPSPDGLIDGIVAGSFVKEFYIAGVKYSPGIESINILNTVGALVGRFTMKDSGAYLYEHLDGNSNVVLDITYALFDPNNINREIMADLHIRSTDKIYEGTTGGDIIDLSPLGIGSENFLVNAGAGDDSILGGLGAEIIYGGIGNDTISGGGGNDQIHGGLGNDLIHGDAGNDTIYGGAGNDTIYGDAGNDVLFGGSGDDYLNGGVGNDTLHGGTGVNTLTGGAGADLFVWGEASFGGHDRIRDFSTVEGDELSFSDLDPGHTGIAFTYLSDYKLDSDKRELSFTLAKQDNPDLATTIDITFQKNDTAFDAMVMRFDALAGDIQNQMHVLAKFIETITQTG